MKKIHSVSFFFSIVKEIVSPLVFFKVNPIIQGTVALSIDLKLVRQLRDMIWGVH